MVHRDDLIEAVRELDYFLLLTPYSPETHNIIGAKVFAAMKPQSFLINHARGGVVDEAALLAALREGRIAGAALDVFATEPLPQDHPFWSMENVLITCHQSATHDASVATNLPIIVENIRRFIAGDIAGMRNVVRPAKLKFGVSSTIGTGSAISIPSRVITHRHAIASTPRDRARSNAAPYFGSMSRASAKRCRRADLDQIQHHRAVARLDHVAELVEVLCAALGLGIGKFGEARASASGARS